MSKKEKEQLQLDGVAPADANNKEVSPKSTKNEILEAYQKLLDQVKDTKQVSHQEIKKKQDEVPSAFHSARHEDNLQSDLRSLIPVWANDMIPRSTGRMLGPLFRGGYLFL